MFSAKIVADSKNEYGNRLTTFVVTFPRIILAEFNTHRMLSKNSASSRAIPYKKALKAVISNPFIPIAFMKDHSGMQGKEFLDPEKTYTFEEVRSVLHKTIVENFKDEEGNWDADWEKINRLLSTNVQPILNTLAYGNKLTIKAWWLKIRDLVVSASLILNAMGVTKQICNRLLEPFMWHTVIVTGTEWANFFGLRLHEAAEIHIQKIAEMMLNVYNESTPKLLKEGEWHIPYESEMIDAEREEEFLALTDEWQILPATDHYVMCKIKMSTVMSARTSFTVVGADQKPMLYQRMLGLHDEMRDAEPKHMSPFEHCGQAKGKNDPEWWSGNFRGFNQYRKMIEGENIKKDPRIIEK